MCGAKGASRSSSVSIAARGRTGQLGEVVDQHHEGGDGGVELELVDVVGDLAIAACRLRSGASGEASSSVTFAGAKCQACLPGPPP